MIYEFHDDKNGTAEEKRDKAKDWLVKYYGMDQDKEDQYLYRANLMLPSTNDLFSLEMCIYWKEELAVKIEDAKLYDLRSVNYLEKVFINFETCCDMFDRGII